MRKTVSIIAAAALAASLTMAGSMSSFATEDTAPDSAAVTEESPTEAPTEAPTEEATEAPTEAPTEEATEAPTEAPTEAKKLEIKDITGKWKYQESSDNAEISDSNAKDTAAVEIKEDGTFSYTDSTGKTVTGNVSIGTEDINGTEFTTVSLTGEGDFKISGYYREGGYISVGNGGISRLIRDNGAAVTTAAATTTKAATTTTAAKKADDKKTSPKTGVAFPALPASGVAMAAAAVAFTLRKKEN